MKAEKTLSMALLEDKSFGQEVYLELDFLLNVFYFN